MEKIGPYLTTTKIRTMEVKYLKVWKNSLHSQILSDFEKFTSKTSKRPAPKFKMDVKRFYRFKLALVYLICFLVS
jgi:hypothetical protein